LCVGEERRTHVLAHEMVDAPARTFAFSLTYYNRLRTGLLQVYDGSKKMWRDLAVDIRLTKLSHLGIQADNAPDGNKNAWHTPFPATGFWSSRRRCCCLGRLTSFFPSYPPLVTGKGSIWDVTSLTFESMPPGISLHGGSGASEPRSYPHTKCMLVQMCASS